MGSCKLGLMLMRFVALSEDGEGVGRGEEVVDRFVSGEDMKERREGELGTLALP